MSDPDDDSLLEFVAKFAGWESLHRPHQWGGSLWGTSPAPQSYLGPVCDYIQSVDAWLRNVWPKVLERSEHGHRLARDWQECLRRIYLDNTTTKSCYSYEIYNASARDRVLALYRAIDGNVAAGGVP